MKPTEEQVKEFWEWCGFKLERIPDKTPFYVLYKPNVAHPTRRGEQYNIWMGRYRGDKLEVWELYPDVDLNNLFKYAEQPLVNYFIETTNTEEEYRLAYYNFLCEWLKDYIWNEPHDPALALFWALDKVKEEIKCPECEGTGTHIKRSPSDFGAVICFTCKGTGKAQLAQKDRPEKQNCDHVFERLKIDHRRCMSCGLEQASYIDQTESSRWFDLLEVQKEKRQ